MSLLPLRSGLKIQSASLVLPIQPARTLTSKQKRIAFREKGVLPTDTFKSKDEIDNTIHRLQLRKEGLREAGSDQKVAKVEKQIKYYENLGNRVYFRLREGTIVSRAALCDPRQVANMKKQEEQASEKKSA